MCGIAGVFTDRGLSEAELRGRAAAMTDCLVHRGPDDEGLHVVPEAGLALGFRRLAILDLSPTGRQPMASESGRYRTVFNGEIYNFRPLRDELQSAGWSFRGTSDTEVMVNAFERWGVPEALKRFNGMFAIAAWDEETLTLWLARDRIGIKPLFVYSEPGFVAFSSELKGLLALPEVGPRLDADAVAAYLRHLYVPAPRSIVEGVRKLEPGRYLRLSSSGKKCGAGEPFWSVEEAAISGLGRRIDTEAAAVDELERLLLDSAELRLQADVPVGALLSGGIDSSAVVSAMQERASGPVKTYTIGFDVAAHDESAHARAVAEHLGTDHHELVLSGDDALDAVPRLPEIFDEPFADPSQIPTYLISQLARGDVTVALSGDGGDELFGGYNRYIYGPTSIRAAEWLPPSVGAATSAALSALSVERWDRLHERLGSVVPADLPQRLFGEKVRKLARLAGTQGRADRYRSFLSAWTDPGAVLRRGSEPPDHIDRILGGESGLSLPERMMLADQLQYLPDDLLAKVDRASMAVSLEVRVPLLDHRIIELSWRLPESMKIRDGTGKWILRQVLARYVPERLVDRPKVGFSVPIAEWLRGPLRDWAEAHLSASALRSDDLLDAGCVGEAWNRLLDGHTDQALPLWAVLMLQSWRERWA